MNTSHATIPADFGDKRYYTWNAFLRQTFGEKVFKVSLDAGFTCPNRDGTAGRGGCVFCSSRGSGDYAGARTDDLPQQFEAIRQRMHAKWPAAKKFIAYFQAFTNTYAPVEVLRKRFEPILALDGVVGLSIATRPDCLPEDVVAYLAEVQERIHLWVELGLQSIHDATGNAINRGHDYACYRAGVDTLREQGIRVCTHIINGLPGETETMMLETAQAVAQQDIQGIKIHLLHVLNHTPLATAYAKGEVALMEKDAYVNLVCDQLAILPPEIVVHRLTGDGPRDTLIGPRWSLKKWEVLNAIDAALAARDCWQGKDAERSPR